MEKLLSFFQGVGCYIQRRLDVAGVVKTRTYSGIEIDDIFVYLLNAKTMRNLLICLIRDLHKLFL